MFWLGPILKSPRNIAEAVITSPCWFFSLSVLPADLLCSHSCYVIVAIEILLLSCNPSVTAAMASYPVDGEI